MPSNHYSEDQMQRLKKRWTRQLINDIVRACNDGGVLVDIIAELGGDNDVSPFPDRMDLRGIDLSHQNLRGPWIVKEGKHVHAGVCLRNSDLTGADLRWVILPRADLRDAILRDVDLSNAELILSDLTGADLTNADLTGAWLLDTKFQNAMKSNAPLK